jgi:hypothetical protein
VAGLVDEHVAEVSQRAAGRIEAARSHHRSHDYPAQ